MARPLAWLALALPALAASAKDYAIVGDLPDVVAEGEAILSRSTGVLGGTEDFASAPIVAGKFRLAGLAEPPGRVWLRLEDPEGNRKGQAQFILEPGEVRVSQGGYAAGLVAHGGAYNQKVIQAWRDQDPYAGVLAEYGRAMQARGELDEGDEEYETLKEESIRLYQEHVRLRREALRAIALAEDDPLASLFAIELGGLGGKEGLARLDALAARLGILAPLVATRSRLEAGVRMREAARAIQPGVRAPDFTSPGLDGEAYALQEALADNDAVLLEFWASWCGPCRAEVPNMKQAYEEHRDRGFEIFAFSLDDDREDWEDASLEDELPWINTSDLKAYDGPVPGLYGVLAIPMNYLLGGDGTVLAVGVRGDELHARLAERFEDAAAQ